MGYPVKYMSGIGVEYSLQLEKAGIKTTTGLLRLCSTLEGLEQMSRKTGIRQELLCGWRHRADLMRVRGIGSQYAELLEAVGVETVSELVTRNADDLRLVLAEVNAHRRLAATAPSLATVRSWIDRAKEMEFTVTF